MNNKLLNNMDDNILNGNNLVELTAYESLSINGGGFFSSLGYGCGVIAHEISDFCTGFSDGVRGK